MYSTKNTNMSIKKMGITDRFFCAKDLFMDIDDTSLEQAAMTLWLFDQIDKTGKAYTVVDNELGFAKNREGKALANLWRGERSHSYEDIIKYSNYFNIPKHIIMVECERLLTFNRGRIIEYIKSRKTIKPKDRNTILKKIL